VNDPTILVADEDDDARIILATALRASGYGCVTAADGAAALGHARVSRVALVVSDLYMACGQRLPLIETLRTDPALGRLPVLAYAAYVFPRDRQRAFELGCVGFIPKPASPGEVIREVRRCVGAPRQIGAPLDAPQPELAGS
jgi:two-component system cell cycle response regulator DivK